MSDDQKPDIEEERKDFEQSITAGGWPVERDEQGRYLISETERRWRTWLARARLAAEREREMAAEIRQLYENLKYQRLRNASADDQFHAIAKYFGGKDATNVESGEKTIAGLVKQECDKLKEALQDLIDVQNGPPLPTYTEAWNAAMAKAQAALAKREERG